MTNKVICVTDYGIEPNTTKDITCSLQKILADICQLKGAVTLSFPQGYYHFYKEYSSTRLYHTSNTNTLDYPWKKIGILLENQRDLTIDGNESTFIFHGNMMALAVVDSQNITLKNFAWDYPCAPTSEMVIDKIVGNKVTYWIPKNQMFYLEQNVMDDNLSSCAMVWYEDSPLTKERYWEFYNDEKCCLVTVYEPKKERLSRHELSESPFANVQQINMPEKSTNDYEQKIEIIYNKEVPSFYQEGVRFEFSRNTYRETAGAFFWQSNNLVVEQVKVHYLYGFGWLTQFCRDVKFLNCTFSPCPGSDRLCSSFADLLHMSSVGGKVSIEDCYFSHAHDDAINIHGTYVKAEQPKNDRTIVFRYVHGQQGGFPQFYVGDNVGIYRDDTLVEVAKLTVAKVLQPNELDGLKMEVTFVEALPSCLQELVDSKLGYVAENIDYIPTVKIHRCKFEMISTRGILCTSSRPVEISENEFKNITMPSVYLSGDSYEWFESGKIQNMLIENNKFGKPAYWEDRKPPPIILIAPITAPSETNITTDLPVHGNIFILGNSFTTSKSESIVASRVKNLIIEGNEWGLLTPNHNEPSCCGLKW